MPFVTVSVKVPSGLPMAIAVCPTSSFVESPMRAGVSPVASILMSARSFVLFESIRVAGYWLPSSSSTVSEELSATTWALVRM